MPFNYCALWRLLSRQHDLVEKPVRLYRIELLHAAIDLGDLTGLTSQLVGNAQVEPGADMFWIDAQRLLKGLNTLGSLTRNAVDDP